MAVEARVEKISDAMEVGTSFDGSSGSENHRALDGAQGAEFLAILKGLIKEPARMIL